MKRCIFLWKSMTWKRWPIHWACFAMTYWSKGRRKKQRCGHWNAGATGDVSLTPGSGRSPGRWHGNPPQYSCLENPMDRGVWWVTVQRVSQSQTRLKRLNMWLLKQDSSQSGRYHYDAMEDPYRALKSSHNVSSSPVFLCFVQSLQWETRLPFLLVLPNTAIRRALSSGTLCWLFDPLTTRGQVENEEVGSCCQAVEIWKHSCY